MKFKKELNLKTEEIWHTRTRYRGKEVVSRSHDTRTGISTTVRRTIVREVCASRHHDGPSEASLETSQTNRKHDTEGFNGCPQLAPHYDERRKTIFPIWHEIVVTLYRKRLIPKKHWELIEDPSQTPRYHTTGMFKGFHEVYNYVPP